MKYWLGVLLFASAAWAGKGQPYGILLLAHGGTPAWNDEIMRIGKALGAQAPTEVALGMADADELQKAVSSLEAKHVRKIVAVPLFINSASEVMDQTRYVLGLREKPSEVLKNALERMAREHAGHPGMMAHHMSFSTTRVSAMVPIVLTAALDDAPEVSEVLFDRAKALSKEPEHETVILVGHGPVDDAANADWLKTMAALARAVQKKGGFSDAKIATIRDDSAPEVKAKAAQGLRNIVTTAAAEGGRAIVIPYVIARGGIEDHIVAALQGLEYVWDGEALCPHPAISRWALEVAAQGAKMDNMRRFK